MTQLFKNKYRIPTTRLPGWDYGHSGCYFITICTNKHIPWFGIVNNANIILSGIGKIALKFWQEIPDRNKNSALGPFIIMPDHMHGILILYDGIDNCRNVACNASTDAKTKITNQNHTMSKISPKSGSISTIIRSYKSAVTRWANNNGYPIFKWQARFYNDIIRDEKAYIRIAKYIINNPARWQEDKWHRR